MVPEMEVSLARGQRQDNIWVHSTRVRFLDSKIRASRGNTPDNRTRDSTLANNIKGSTPGNNIRGNTPGNNIRGNSQDRLRALMVIRPVDTMAPPALRNILSRRLRAKPPVRSKPPKSTGGFSVTTRFAIVPR